MSRKHSNKKHASFDHNRWRSGSSPESWMRMHTSRYTARLRIKSRDIRDFAIRYS